MQECGRPDEAEWSQIDLLPNEPELSLNPLLMKCQTQWRLITDESLKDQMDEPLSGLSWLSLVIPAFPSISVPLVALISQAPRRRPLTHYYLVQRYYHGWGWGFRLDWRCLLEISHLFLLKEAEADKIWQSDVWVCEIR